MKLDMTALKEYMKFAQKRKGEVIVWKLDEHRQKMLSFTTKAEYLEWRDSWKAEYKELSKQIREFKKARKGGFILVKGTYGSYWTNPPANDAVKHGLYAFEMLTLRRLGKERSQELKRARLSLAS